MGGWVRYSGQSPKKRLFCLGPSLRAFGFISGLQNWLTCLDLTCLGHAKHLLERNKAIFIPVFNLVDRLRVKGSSEITSKRGSAAASIDLDDSKATLTLSTIIKIILKIKIIYII